MQKAQLASTQPYQSLGEQQPKRDKRGAFEVPNSLPLRATFLGLFGLLLGVILALVLERLNRRIDTRPELAEACPLPIIAEVGFVAANRRPTADGSLILTGVWAEAYRRVRSAMQFVYERGTFGATGETTEATKVGVDGAERGGVFMITSTAPGEGKTTSAALTAQAMAEVGVRTLLVGADFRRPTLAGVMGVEPGATIADLTGPAEGRPKVDQVVRPTKFPNLYLALSGQPTRDVSELIAATRQLVSQAAAQNATVIIDTSPLNASSDALDLLPVVDHVIMVVRSGRSTENDLVESVDALERVGANVMGTLLVGTPNAGRRQAYYYDYYSVEGLDGPGDPSKPVEAEGSFSATGPSKQPERGRTAAPKPTRWAGPLDRRWRRPGRARARLEALRRGRRCGVADLRAGGAGLPPGWRRRHLADGPATRSVSRSDGPAG
ncbi:MAG: CpsD/CapB family tyrosine-protein kinase [Candidatus Microthrix sp.]|nr:CpsD/CapB family tyrosine-protein kinase [Candidatus Microthrix sp.]